MKTVLITGCSGFIGMHLSEDLLKDNYTLIGVDNMNDYYDINLKKDRLNRLNNYKDFTFYNVDISNKIEINKVFKKSRPNIVVNLAAQAGVRYSISNPEAYVDSNIVGFMNILEECRHSNVEGLIYASSSSVYGGNKKIPFSEDDNVDKPISIYAASKKANELMAHAYSHLYDLNTTGLRFFTVYGPWGRPDMAMYIFADRITKKKQIPVFNHGNMKRDFTYIDDIILGIRKSIEKNYSCEINPTKQLIETIHNNYYYIENPNKPIKGISTYKINEIFSICNKLGIKTHLESGKSKTKKQLYTEVQTYL